MIRRQREGERGAALILITASLLVIMGVAAVVVDGGLGFNERRQAQSGADFAALAALQKAVSCPAPCTAGAAAQNGAIEAFARVEGNFPGRYTAADWLACTDPTRPAKFINVASNSPCVSFTVNFDESRVVLPPDTMETTFGRAIGFSSLTIGAFAEAGQDSKVRTAVIPHTPNGTSGDEACLFSTEGPKAVDPCSGAASGFFGYLDVPLYGDDEVGTPSTCNNGDTNKRIAINVAKGSDHNMVVYKFLPTPDTIVNDHAACPNTNEEVNELRVETGASIQTALTNGLFNGVSGNINGQPITASPGRLICDLTTYSTACVNIRNFPTPIDHTGLWEFLAGGCPAGVDTHDEMKDCLENNNPSFTIDILSHPRFAAIPIFHTPPSGPGNYKIKEFIPVWLEKTYYECTAANPSCGTVHSPGEVFDPLSPPGTPPACPNPLTSAVDNCGWSAPGTLKFEGLTALMLEISMLPAEVQEDFPGVRGRRTYFLTE